METPERKVLSAADILEANDLPTESVFIPEWGGLIIMRTLTGRERDRLESDMLTGKNGKAVNLDNVRARMVVAAAIDEAGKQLFQPDQIDKLGDKSGPALSKAAEVAQRLAGLAAADVEDLAKNSSRGPAA